MKRLSIDRTKLPCTIDVYGTITENVKPANGTDFKCAELQKMVDGHFDIIYLHEGDEGLIMVLDDDGKFTKEPNLFATAIALNANAIFANDYIAGDVLICDTDMIK